ncbi:hypothetical protein LSCM1_03739 [Leishmania martiniquensis]|uniref:Uncharacterized protein n=1 Tax=Leishmania martiniquensis TaxID=1580590 RepID=A0A836KIX9_9TRYP|nr:hypothetical protein LSCM1_03739 [Leishmania martiniquensis]
MRLLSLRELVVLFDTQLQQLTLSHLARGFFAWHTAVVSVASLAVCASLALATHSDAAALFRPAPLLFTSFASFAALSVLTLMTLTLLYRLIGGRFDYSPRATGYVVDWVLDTVSRPLVEDTVHVLFAPNMRRERGVFFTCLWLVGEIGKYLSFWPACTLVSMLWCGWSVRGAWREHRCAG